MPDANLEQRAEVFLALAEKEAKSQGVVDAHFVEAALNDAPALVADLLAEVRRLRQP